MQHKILSFTATIGLLLSAALAAYAQSDDIYYAAGHNYRIVPVADGLVQPWSMAWLPGGDMLVTEKPGRLRIIRNGQLLPEAVPGVPEVFYPSGRSQAGLFDILPHPDFANNRWVYLSYAKPQGGSASATAISRARLENDTLTNVTEIFVSKSVGNGHYGGRLVIDEDGYLFLTVGDRQAPSRGDLYAHPAQDTTNHNGVVVRLHDDGSIPDDNPFVDSDDVLPEIWTYGHRSPQGLAINPLTGDLWETEHGPQGGDELNLLEPGKNYGWPVVGYGVNYGSIGSPIHEGIAKEGMESPDFFWVPSIATSGLMVYSGDKFPLWFGSIFAGGLIGEQVARMTFNDDYSRVLVEDKLAYGMGRIRDLRQGQDGYIYLAIEDREGEPTSPAIVRLEPVD